MPTQLLSIGPAYVLAQNVVYALPVKPSTLTSTAACEQSVDGVAWTALASGGTANTKFIRCTTASPTVSLAVSTGGGGSIGPSTDVVAASLAVGTNPAQSGVLRIPNNQFLRGRNAANNADLDILRIQTDNAIAIGNSSFTLYFIGALFQFAGGTVSCGGLTVGSNPLTVAATSHIILNEKTPAPPPVTNGVAIWCEDDGSGKTRLMARFGTGANVQIAIEP